MSTFSISGSSSSGCSRPTPKRAAWTPAATASSSSASSGVRPCAISWRANSSRTRAITARANCNSSSVDIGGRPVAASSRRWDARRSPTSCRNRLTREWSMALPRRPARAGDPVVDRPGHLAGAADQQGAAQPPAPLAGQQPGALGVVGDGPQDLHRQVRRPQHLGDLGDGPLGLAGRDHQHQADAGAHHRSIAQHAGQRRQPVARVGHRVDRGPRHQRQQGGVAQQRRAGRAGGDAPAVGQHVRPRHAPQRLAEAVPQAGQPGGLLGGGHTDQHLQPAVQRLHVVPQLLGLDAVTGRGRQRQQPPVRVQRGAARSWQAVGEVAAGRVALGDDGALGPHRPERHRDGGHPRCALVGRKRHERHGHPARGTSTTATFPLEAAWVTAPATLSSTTMETCLVDSPMLWPLAPWRIGCGLNGGGRRHARPDRGPRIALPADRSTSEMSTISYSCGITVLDAASGAREDVLVSIDGTATVRDVAHAIEDSLASRAPSAATAGPARTGAATEGPAGPGPGAGAWRREPADERAGDQRLAIVIRHPRFTQAAAASLPGPGPSPAEPRLGDRDPLTLWVDGGPLAAELPAARVLRDGMVVSLSPRYAPATSLAEPGGMAEVRIVGGPASGSVRRLGLGRFEIGGDPRCAVAVADPSVPPRAAVVSVVPDGASLEPAPGATLALDGEALGGPAAWPYGGVLAVGDSLLALHLREEADASLVPGDDGGLVYNRPPQLLPPRRSRRLVVPSQPVQGDGPRLGVLTMVLPALFGVGMAVMLHQVLYLSMALLGPLTMGAGAWSDKRTGRKRHGAAMREYEQARRKHSEDLERLRAADEVERREACPDPATLLLVATGPRRRLWERRAGDHDVLRLRVGTADLPAAIELARDRGGQRPTEEEGGGPPDARHVPVPLDLEALGVVGVAGDRAAARGLARWLVAQAAILHSPRDLQVVVLATTEDWEWVRWLP